MWEGTSTGGLGVGGRGADMAAARLTCCRAWSWWHGAAGAAGQHHITVQPLLFRPAPARQLSPISSWCHPALRAVLSLRTATARSRYHPSALPHLDCCAPNPSTQVVETPLEQLAQREGGQQGQDGQQGGQRELGGQVQERQGPAGGGSAGRLAVLSAVVTDVDLDARVGAVDSWQVPKTRFDWYKAGVYVCSSCWSSGVGVVVVVVKEVYRCCSRHSASRPSVWYCTSAWCG